MMMAKKFDPHEPNKSAPVNPRTEQKERRERAVVRQDKQNAGQEPHRQVGGSQTQRDEGDTDL
jgi:hypothetical protein